jgi:hypothetical protein
VRLEHEDLTLNLLLVLDTGLGYFSALAALESLTPCQRPAGSRGDDSGSVKCHRALDVHISARAE